MEIPPDALSCPACGVYAGDVLDGRVSRRRPMVLFLVPLLALIGLSAWFTMRRPAPPAPPATTLTIPPRVVHDRPGTTRRAAGARLTEPEAILTLRRHLVATQNLPSSCIAILSNGFHNGAYTLTAVDSCKNAKLGRWRVDGTSGRVSK